MKASIPRVPVAAAFAAGFLALSTAFAGTVVMTDGQTREGEITGVRGGAVRLKIGPAETAIPLASVASVEMPPPQEFLDAGERMQKGDADGALKLLGPVVEKFQGLPVPWAERASSMLPEVLIQLGRQDDADSAFKKFQALYPDAVSSVDILSARMAIESGDFSGAGGKLESIVAEAKATKLPGPAKGSAHSQALYLMGRVLENEGRKSEALENYLLVTTVFTRDPSSVALAAERAKALEAEGVVVP
jgi:predicted Zn-dependent protease